MPARGARSVPPCCAASHAGVGWPCLPVDGWVGHVFIGMKGRTMNDIAGGAQAPPSQERPTGELVKQLSEQVSVLVREELKLAQLEMTRKGKQAGVGAGMLGGGGVIALYGLGCLIACVILAITEVLAALAFCPDRGGGPAGCGRGRGADG